MSPGSVQTINRAMKGRWAHTVVTIPKSRLPYLPRTFTETELGTPLPLVDSEAVAQYRGPNKMHIIEKERVWQVHKDKVDPNRDQLGHIVEDAPEFVVAPMVGVGIGYLGYGFAYNSKYNETGNEQLAREHATFWGAITGIIAGVLTFFAVRSLRR